LIDRQLAFWHNCANQFPAIHSANNCLKHYSIEGHDISDAHHHHYNQQQQQLEITQDSPLIGHGSEPGSTKVGRRKLRFVIPQVYIYLYMYAMPKKLTKKSKINIPPLHLHSASLYL
jgi:hypothetical protein